MEAAQPFPHEAADAAEQTAAEQTAAVEALLFAAERPLAAAEIAGILAAVSGAEVTAPDAEALVRRLDARLAAGGHALRVHRWAGGYRLAAGPQWAPYAAALRGAEQRKRLTRTLLETLAVVAYRQPVTKPEIDFIRGVDSDYALGRLLELGLADVVGRSEGLGKPLQYGTTPVFLEQFGLGDLADLPSLRDIEEILGDPLFSKERARLLSLQGLGADDAPDPDEGDALPLPEEPPRSTPPDADQREE